MYRDKDVGIYSRKSPVSREEILYYSLKRPIRVGKRRGPTRLNALKTLKEKAFARRLHVRSVRETTQCRS
jgi:hypothetical protein